MNDLTLVDRADGCKGSFCIRRMHDKGYAEYWNNKTKTFGAFGTVVSRDCGEEVIKLIKRLRK